jgi:hypothetical protein
MWSIFAQQLLLLQIGREKALTFSGDDKVIGCTDAITAADKRIVRAASWIGTVRRSLSSHRAAAQRV